MQEETRPNALLITAAMVVVLAGLKAAEAIVVPLMLAAFLATIAATPVFWLNRFRVPVALAITVVVAGLIVVLFGMGSLVAQSADDFYTQLPQYRSRLVELTDGLLRWLASLGAPVSTDQLRGYFDPSVALQMAGTTLVSFGSVLSNGFLILLTVIFILAEASSFPAKLRQVLADPDEGMPHFESFANNINRYIGIKTTVSLATGTIIGVYLALLGVDFPVLWGLLAFLLNYVPNIGSIIAAIPAVLLALVQLGPGFAAAAAAGFVAVNIVMGNVVEPRFMGRGLGLSTLIVFLSLVFWGWMFGPVGMLLSVPLTMTAKIALEANPHLAWIAHLLGPAEAESAAAQSHPDAPPREAGALAEAE